MRLGLRGKIAKYVVWLIYHLKYLFTKYFKMNVNSLKIFNRVTCSTNLTHELDMLAVLYCHTELDMEEKVKFM